MTSGQEKTVGAAPTQGPGSGTRRVDRKERPEWASGLRQLYDSVVEEDLPDQFKDLLSQLDTKN